MSTMYVSWWSHRPSAIIKTLRRTLKAALLEAGLRGKKKAEVVEPPATAVKSPGAQKKPEVLEPPTKEGPRTLAPRSGSKSPSEQKKPEDQSELRAALGVSNVSCINPWTAT